MAVRADCDGVVGDGVPGRSIERRTRAIAASEWIYANVPRRSALTSEIWDDSLPYALPNTNFTAYRNIATEPVRDGFAARR